MTTISDPLNNLDHQPAKPHLKLYPPRLTTDTHQRAQIDDGFLSPRSPQSATPLNMHSESRAITQSVSAIAGSYASYSVTTAPDAKALDAFEAKCHLMFFNQDPAAAAYVNRTMKSLPAGSKAAYTKRMAAVRSAFHREASSSRRAEVDRLLTETKPSSEILRRVGFDGSLVALRSPRAQHERQTRLAAFINAHCLRDMVGVHPFFMAFYAVLHLSTLPAERGGAGERRVEWELDSTLFAEAGGLSFMRDSILLLKGVLGFEDHLLPLAAPSFTSSIASTVDDHLTLDTTDGTGLRSEPSSDDDDGEVMEERQEREVDAEGEAAFGTPGSGLGIEVDGEEEVEEGPFADSSSNRRRHVNSKGRPLMKRARSTSDPFLDPVDTNLGPRSPSIIVSPADEGDKSGTSTPATRSIAVTRRTNHMRSPTQNSLDAPLPSELRIFRTASFLGDPEIRRLLKVFPPFIATRANAARFGRGIGSEPGLVKIGHGVLRMSVFERDEGWKGGLMERFKAWLAALLGRK